MNARLGIAGVEYPVRPMIAVTAQELPTSSSAGWAYEPKMDGFRLLAHRGTKRVALHSRQQRPLGLYFPEIVAALRQLDVEVVLDGELVLWRNGRLDFAGLQQRLHPAESRVRALSIATPASFVVFDVLALNGEPALTMLRGATESVGGPLRPPASARVDSHADVHRSKGGPGRGYVSTPMPGLRES